MAWRRSWQRLTGTEHADRTAAGSAASARYLVSQAQRCSASHAERNQPRSGRRSSRFTIATARTTVRPTFGAESSPVDPAGADQVIQGRTHHGLLQALMASHLRDRGGAGGHLGQHCAQRPAHQNNLPIWKTATANVQATTSCIATPKRVQRGPISRHCAAKRGHARRVRHQEDHEGQRRGDRMPTRRLGESGQHRRAQATGSCGVVRARRPRRSAPRTRSLPPWPRSRRSRWTSSASCRSRPGRTPEPQRTTPRRTPNPRTGTSPKPCPGVHRDRLQQPDRGHRDHDDPRGRMQEALQPNPGHRGSQPQGRDLVGGQVDHQRLDRLAAPQRRAQSQDRRR